MRTVPAPGQSPTLHTGAGRLKTPKEKGRGFTALGSGTRPRRDNYPRLSAGKPKAGNVGWRNVPGPCPVSSAQELLSLCLRAPFLKQEKGRGFTALGSGTRPRRDNYPGLSAGKQRAGAKWEKLGPGLICPS